MNFVKLINNVLYCNLQISFERIENYEWEPFTHILLKIRGDGRSYKLTMQMNEHFDIHWHNMYHVPLFTRGGPYWQIAKVNIF